MDIIVIREESPEDIPAIYRINETAFGRPHEALLVNRLREQKAIIHSLVAEEQGELIGHVLFSPIMVHSESGVVVVACALGPVAVLPEKQKEGIGSMLIEAGIKLCLRAGYPAMFVLGHPSYYPRLGFRPASQFGISCAYEVPEEAFMALELQYAALQGVSGVAHYHSEFDGV
jgi:putative acetyltransferase